MNSLYRIVYAAHANGSHHKLALDALRYLDMPAAESWQRVFLKHVEMYLEGSKAPDKQFKDFKNHVLHVRDDYWGGAPEKARNWYDHMVRAAVEHNWEEMVWCAGVLSHYYTDPIHPFHTAQSEAENNVHRAVEWSISKSYDEIRRIGVERFEKEPLTAIPEGDNWLAELVCIGAERSNASYEALISHYDFRRGVVDPPAGLDQNARVIVADLVIYAARTFAKVLERGLAEAAEVPPDVSLSVDTVIAGLKIPAKWVTRKLSDAGDRALVERMYDELQATGRVEKNLPEDDRQVRELYRKEVLAKRSQPSVSEKFPVPAHKRPAAVRRAERAARVAAPDRKDPPPLRVGDGARVGPRPPSGPLPLDPRRPSAAAKAQPPAETAKAKPGSTGTATSVPVTSQPRMSPAGPSQPTGVQSSPIQPPAAPETTGSDSEPGRARSFLSLGDRLIRRTPQSGGSGTPGLANARERRIYLKPEDEIVAAPSIGPKTAARLIDIGVKTVADLLAADPGALAEQLDNSHIRAKTVADWQDQAKLVCAVPGLRGTHAQLLVGAGFATIERIARAEANDLLAAVLRFAQTAEGQRVLRSGDPPDMEKVVSWVDEARQALSAAA